MRRALAIAALLLASCAPEPIARPPEDPAALASATAAPGGEVDPLASIAGRPPTRAEARAIAVLLDVAERIRSLSFREPVPFRIQDRATITQFVRDQMEADELERARVFYVALGLIGPDVDVYDLLVRVLGEQIVGYYDPERSLMVVREDVAEQLGEAGEVRGERRRELGEAEMVIVHELVHALQDQQLGLGERYEQERSIDEENAFASVVEGDATLAMIGHLAEREGQSLSRLTQNAGLLRMLIRQSPTTVSGQEIEGAPAIVRVPLISRYLDGLVFCATLHGGSGWSGVDAAHRRGPRSTEHVLHPERWAAGDDPETIALPELPELTAAGLVRHDEDTLGELETSIYFGLGAGTEREESAAEGWGGDRLRVYRTPEGGTAVVWFTTWDDEGEAREAEAAALAVVARAPEAERASHGITRRGRALLIVRTLAPALHAPVARAFDAFASATVREPPRAAGTTLDAL